MLKKDLGKPEESKKSNVSGTPSQEGREAARDIESYNFWTWLVPFITTGKTKSNVSLKVALS